MYRLISKPSQALMKVDSMVAVDTDWGLGHVEIPLSLNLASNFKLGWGTRLVSVS